MNKKAFTLAETLIALGIIGVVATITLPNVISNYQKKITVSRLKKAYSDIQNAVRLSSIENGEPSEWEISFVGNGVRDSVQTYYLPYFKSAKVTKSYNIYNLNRRKLPSLRTYITLQNGTVLSFFGEGPASAWMFVDINGKAKPNRVGRDIFVLNYYNNKKFLPIFEGSNLGIDRIKNAGINIPDEQQESNRVGFGCSSQNKNGYYAGFYCGALIQLNNWEIPDDYPW